MRLFAAATCVALLVRPAAAGALRQDDLAARPARPSPAWVRDGVVYELNTRPFSDAGTFNAVTARLPELRQLGVTIIWFMPVHPIGQEKKKGTIGSPYAVRDYYRVNPQFGSEADFRRLVREAHGLGLKVIIDVVANHTSWDNPMMKTPSFYRRDSTGRVLSPYDWSDVAALDYGNPAVRAEMSRILQHWLREYDLDGFRCDVAWLVPVDFWEAVRKDLERIKPDIVLLAESHEPPLLREAFDLDYSWPLYHALKDAITGSRPARAVREEWETEQRRYPRGALHLRFSDNHDEKRAVALFGERGALAASAVVFTLDGVPLLYNGMEVGDATESGAPALFEKLPVFWGSRDRRPEFPQFYSWMIGLRRDHPALRRGALTWIRNSDEDRVLTFLRQHEGETILVAVNLSNRPFLGT
ncbi:MAG: alpha-amylase family glycosyl hydrolase, partial [Gemmatimonadales bacterium]